MMGVLELGLMAANAAVSVLNVMSWAESRELRDMFAAIAWAGSAAYWLIRSVVG